MGVGRNYSTELSVTASGVLVLGQLTIYPLQRQLFLVQQTFHQEAFPLLFTWEKQLTFQDSVQTSDLRKCFLAASQSPPTNSAHHRLLLNLLTFY